jgi:hypothetical protein
MNCDCAGLARGGDQWIASFRLQANLNYSMACGRGHARVARPRVSAAFAFVLQLTAQYHICWIKVRALDALHP